jgi:transposase-like protein
MRIVKGQYGYKSHDWIEANLPEGFTVFAFPLLHQKRLRTSNILETLSQEIK